MRVNELLDWNVFDLFKMIGAALVEHRNESSGARRINTAAAGV
jgi:hypothetical protein